LAEEGVRVWAAVRSSIKGERAVNIMLADLSGNVVGVHWVATEVAPNPGRAFGLEVHSAAIPRAAVFTYDLSVSTSPLVIIIPEWALTFNIRGHYPTIYTRTIQELDLRIWREQGHRVAIC
jgi:hypothetical protein